MLQFFTGGRASHADAVEQLQHFRALRWGGGVWDEGDEQVEVAMRTAPAWVLMIAMTWIMTA